MMVLIYYKRVSSTVGFLNPVPGTSCLQYVVLFFTDALVVIGFLATPITYVLSAGTVPRFELSSDIKDTPDILDNYGQVHYEASERYYMCMSWGIGIILAVLRICADLERRGVVIELKRNREIKDLNKT
jgi:hypothetical protein